MGKKVGSWSVDETRLVIVEAEGKVWGSLYSALVCDWNFPQWKGFLKVCDSFWIASLLLSAKPDCGYSFDPDHRHSFS